MADMMKNSSMHTAPKGRMPPSAMLNAGCVYHTWSGMCLAIWLVRTGAVMVSFLKPK
jgi:hypothetical protein